jgi:hypothetical protein
MRLRCRIAVPLLRPVCGAYKTGNPETSHTILRIVGLETAKATLGFIFSQNTSTTRETRINPDKVSAIILSLRPSSACQILLVYLPCLRLIGVILPYSLQQAYVLVFRYSTESPACIPVVVVYYH